MINTLFSWSHSPHLKASQCGSSTQNKPVVDLALRRERFEQTTPQRHTHNLERKRMEQRNSVREEEREKREDGGREREKEREGDREIKQLILTHLL